MSGWNKEFGKDWLFFEVLKWEIYISWKVGKDKDGAVIPESSKVISPEKNYVFDNRKTL